MEFKETQVTIVNKYVSQEDISKKVLELIVNKVFSYINNSSTIEVTEKENIAG
ncbi:MAG: hypothetical protein PWQ60_1914 [Thermoanaerobacteraceae bacterium]|nr:hypothetical protein [Thermoanaerobacteraceae bacterium]